jgi:large subunit ribosomal protein L28
MSKKCDLLAVSVMSGNNVSHSNRKTRRKFYPNLKEMSFRSEVLGVDINLRLAASSLRTVNKYGNIDNFLINYRFAKLTDVAKKYRSKIKSKLVKSGKLAEFKIVKESRKLKAKTA